MDCRTGPNMVASLSVSVVQPEASRFINW